MTNEDFIRVGIIAGRELNVPPDVKIEMASGNSDYCVRVNLEDHYVYTTYETDIVRLQFWKWQRESGNIWGIGLGYSKKCNVLVIWPDTLIAEK